MDLSLLPREVLFSPDGHLIAVGGFSGLQVFTLRGELVLSIAGFFFEDLSFSPDGHQLAATNTGCANITCWGSIDLYDLENELPPRTFLRFDVDKEEYFDPTVAISHSGRLVALNDLDGTVEILDVSRQSRRTIVQLQGTTALDQELVFTPYDKYLVHTDRDGLLSVWEVGSGEVVGTARSRAGAEPTVRVAPSGGELYIWGTDGMEVWSLDERGLILRSRRLMENILGASPHLHHVAVGSQDVVQVLDESLREPVAELSNYLVLGPPARFSSDGRYLVVVSRGPHGSSGSMLRVWSVFENDWFASLPLPSGFDVQVEFSPDSSMIAGMVEGEGRIFVWDLETGDRLSMINIPAAKRIAFHPRPNLLGIATSDGLFIYDLMTNNLREVARIDLAMPQFVDFDRTGTVIIVAEAESEYFQPFVRAWSVEDGIEVAQFSPPPVRPVTGWELYALDGYHLIQVTGEQGSRENNVEIWEIDTGDTSASFPTTAGHVAGLSITSERSTVVLTSYLHVSIWHVDSGQPLLKFNSYGNRNAILSPDLRTLAIVKDNYVVHLVPLDS